MTRPGSSGGVRTTVRERGFHRPGEEMGKSGKRWVDLALVLAVVALLVMFAFFIKPWVTADAVAFLRTSGIACQGCAAAGREAPVAQQPVDCEECTSRIVTAVNGRNGVAWVTVDRAGGEVVVGFDSASVRPEAIAATMTDAGYRSSVIRVVSADQYGRMPGGNHAVRKGTTGCGGSCAMGK